MTSRVSITQPCREFFATKFVFLKDTIIVIVIYRLRPKLS